MIFSQVAVACKSCPGCKHSFHNTKRLSLAQALHYTDAFALASRRRTERVKREKPNYYDSSEFEKKVSKVSVFFVLFFIGLTCPHLLN